MTSPAEANFMTLVSFLPGRIVNPTDGAYVHETHPSDASTATLTLAMVPDTHVSLPVPGATSMHDDECAGLLTIIAKMNASAITHA